MVRDLKRDQSDVAVFAIKVQLHYSGHRANRAGFCQIRKRKQEPDPD